MTTTSGTNLALPRVVGDSKGPGLPAKPRGQPNDPFIPIRPGDLVRMLVGEPGVSPSEQVLLDQLTQLIGAVQHHQYFALLKELQDLYSPLDPDSDCIDIQGDSLPLSSRSDEAFIAPFEKMLEHANFRPLSTEEIDEAIRAPNELGLNYVPKFELFDQLRVFVRGRTPVTRIVRNLKTRFRRKPVVLDGYERVAVILKFKPGGNLGPYASSDHLYLRLFKDVPRVDMEMHLPEQGASVRMRLIDKAQIASPLMIGVPTLLLKIVFTAFFTPAILGGLLLGPLSAGVNSFFGFKRAKQKHLHHMIRHLYYLNLANNASVITRIVSAAEDEDFKETLLAYFFLWRGSIEGKKSYTADTLSDSVRRFLCGKLDMTPAFEVTDALRKLCELELAQIDQATGAISVLSIESALERLDRLWDDLYTFTRPTPGVGQ